MSEQSPPRPPRWMFWSSRESIENGVPSAMAIVETVLAVSAYWFFAIHYQTYAPLLLGIAVAPLVLLRSDTSVALGVRWFLGWKKGVWDDNRAYGALTKRERSRFWQGS